MHRFVELVDKHVMRGVEQVVEAIKARPAGAFKGKLMQQAQYLQKRKWQFLVGAVFT